MANYNDLLTAINSVIKTNNRREITGLLLQNVLDTMVGSLGANYQLAGFATPTTNPQSPDQNVFYVASQAGVYTQFDNIVLDDGLSFLMWKNGAWTSHTVPAVSQTWVQNNFVSKEWFRKVFRVYDANDLEIVPNDMESVADNIKAMVGLWTNQYLSALGMGQDGGGAVQTLAGLSDVAITTPSANQMLSYDVTTQKWVNVAIPATGVTSVATGTGLTGGTITGTGTISINSTYQTYISHGESAYNSLGNYLPLSGGTMTGVLSMGLTGASIILYTGDYQFGCNETDDFYIWSTNNSARFRVGTNNLERLTVLTNGNVGIGTQSPSYLLDINGISKSVYMLFKNYNNTGDAGYVGRGSTQNNTIFLGGYIGNAIGIGANDSVTDIWINTSHNVGINTQEPSYTLDVNGTARANNYLTSSSNGSYVQIGAIRLVYDSTNNAIKVIKSDGTNASLYATGGLSALGAGQESGGGGIGMMDYLLFKNVNDSGSAGYVGRGGTSNNTIYLSAYSGNALGIGANDSSRDIWINTSHYVGIGTMSPLELLHVEGTIYNSGYLRSIGFLVTDEVYSHPSLGSLYQRDRSVALIIRGGKYGLFSYVLGNGNAYFQVGRSDGDTSVYDLCMQTSGGNVGIGVDTTSYKLHVAGTVGATGFTNTSDIRKKNRIKDVDLRLDQIAKAPAFEYYWLDKSIDHDLHVGTSAQYWENVLPEVVSRAKDEMGTLSLQYGVAALISAITVARKVMTHEEKIALLETRVSALEKENGEQEQLINSLQEELAKFKAA